MANGKYSNNETVTVAVMGGRDFHKGVKYAKSFGGSYNPADKTWTIPTHRNGVYNNALNAPGNYGLRVVGAGGTVAQGHKAQHDSNCPAAFGGACECDAQTG